MGYCLNKRNATCHDDITFDECKDLNKSEQQLKNNYDIHFYSRDPYYHYQYMKNNGISGKVPSKYYASHDYDKDSWKDKFTNHISYSYCNWVKNNDSNEYNNIKDICEDSSDFEYMVYKGKKSIKCTNGKTEIVTKNEKAKCLNDPTCKAIQRIDIDDKTMQKSLSDNAKSYTYVLYKNCNNTDLIMNYDGNQKVGEKNFN